MSRVWRAVRVQPVGARRAMLVVSRNGVSILYPNEMTQGARRLLTDLGYTVVWHQHLTPKRGLK